MSVYWSAGEREHPFQITRRSGTRAPRWAPDRPLDTATHRERLFFHESRTTHRIAYRGVSSDHGSPCAAERQQDSHTDGRDPKTVPQRRLPSFPSLNVCVQKYPCVYHLCRSRWAEALREISGRLGAGLPRLTRFENVQISKSFPKTLASGQVQRTKHDVSQSQSRTRKGRAQSVSRPVLKNATQLSPESSPCIFKPRRDACRLGRSRGADSRWRLPFEFYMTGGRKGSLGCEGDTMRGDPFATDLRTGTPESDSFLGPEPRK